MPNLAENFVDWMKQLDDFNGVPITHVQAIELTKDDDSMTVAVNIPEPVDVNDIGLGDDDCDHVVQGNVTLFARDHVLLRDTTRSFKDSLKLVSMIGTTEVTEIITVAHVYGIEVARDDRVLFSRLTADIQYKEMPE